VSPIVELWVGSAVTDSAKSWVPAGRNAMSFGIYLTGFVVVIAGLIYGAALMHVPTHWIVVGGMVLVGVGILTGVKATRQKDSAT
jgi:cadmium resistance protein CadD (predicted permease)